MAKLLWRWALICSECDHVIKLFVADKIPKNCPNCNVEFEVSNGKDSIHQGPEHTIEKKKEEKLYE